jgi:hypothetical protein
MSSNEREALELRAAESELILQLATNGHVRRIHEQLVREYRARLAEAGRRVRKS